MSLAFAVCIFHYAIIRSIIFGSFSYVFYVMALFRPYVRPSIRASDRPLTFFSHLRN